jgi:hypothetical protein
MKHEYNILFSREVLKEKNIKKDLYYFDVLMDSELRGYNRCIKVSVLHKDGRPTLIGYIHLHSSTNCGYYAEVCHFLSTLMGYKLNTDGYDLLNKKVKIFKI